MYSGRQRGYTILEIFIYIGIALALVAAFVWLVGIVRAWVIAHDKAQYDAGYAAADAAYKARDNQQLEKLAAALKKATEEKDALERKRADDIRTLEDGYEAKLKKQKGDHDRFVADVVAGRIVYHDPGKTGGCPKPVDPGATSAAAGDPARPALDGGGGGLSREATIFLRGEAVRANGVLEKLTLCRGTLKTIYGAEYK